MDIASVAFTVIQIGATFSLAPFDAVLQPLIAETLAAQQQDSNEATHVEPPFQESDMGRSRVTP